MKTRLVVFAIAMIVIMALGMFAALKPTNAATTYGPRIDQLLYKIYPSSTNEFTAFQAHEIELVDTPLTQTLVPVINSTPGMTLDKYRGDGMFQIDINNNETVPSYPGILSPTSDVHFRQAIAYMVDKPYIVNVILGGWAVQMDTPIKPWYCWYVAPLTTYSYNPALACQTLYDNGWKSSADPNVVTNVHFPASWPTLPGGPNVAGQDLVTVFSKTDVGFGAGSGPGLIFIRQSEYPSLNSVGQFIIYGDGNHKGLVNIGIPVDDFSVPKSVSTPPVKYMKNFHFYTGSWSFGEYPYYLYEMWHSQWITPAGQPSPNYDNINNKQWDANITAVKFASTIDAADVAANKACAVFASNEFFIPLWTPMGYLAHWTNWHIGLLDGYALDSKFMMGYGPRMFFPYLTANNPSIGITGGTMNVGLANDAQQLNVIYSEWYWDWQILDMIYDRLLRENPWNSGIELPWMSSSWTEGTWMNPNSGMSASVITFTLRTDMKWINPVTGTVYGPVTPDDVAFTFQYVYDHAGWNAPLVSDIFRNTTGPNAGKFFIKTTTNTITVYMNQFSAFARPQLADIPIIPKAIFQTITDPTGFYPGGASNIAALTGSGPFYFGSYTPGTSCLLLANRNFYKPIFPNIDNDPTHIHIDWGIFKSNVIYTWQVNVLDLIVIANNLGPVGCYPGWTPHDVNKDGHVNVLDLIIVATDLGANWP